MPGYYSLYPSNEEASGQPGAYPENPSIAVRYVINRMQLGILLIPFYILSQSHAF